MTAINQLNETYFVSLLPPSSWCMWTPNAQLAKQGIKLSATQSFCKCICKLCMSGNIRRLQIVTNNLITDEVTIHVNMLSTLMKDGILCNMQRNLIVAVELYRHRMTDPKAGKNSLDPLQFTRGTSHRPILSFSGRTRYCMLFFGFPRNWRVTQENNPSGKRPTSKRTSSPIRVTPSIQL